MYTSSWHASKSRLYIATLGISLAGFAFVGGCAGFYMQFIEDRIESSDIAIAIPILLLMLWGIFFAFRPIILQTLQCCFTVDPGDTCIVGITIFNRRISLDYEAIEKIIAIKRYSFLRANILLIDSAGNELEIHHNIDFLGNCIEEIRKRCPNLKEVDYEGMDRIPAIWSAGNKHAML